MHTSSIELETRDNVTYIKRPRRFTLEEANVFLPSIVKLTTEAIEKVQPLMKKLQDPRNLEDKKLVTIQIQQTVAHWTDQVLCFGAQTRGLWMVEFETGTNFFNWSYGEKEIMYQRDYNQSFDQRTLIEKTS
jgi:hypothetical protein